MKYLFIMFMFIAVVMLTACRAETPDAQASITITYANWNLGPDRDNALEIQMLQAFMNEYPHIYVSIDELVSPPWTDSLAAAAGSGNLPDVFMIDDLGHMAANGWLKDITALAAADEDFRLLPGIIQEATRTRGAVYALPFALRYHGYFVNQQLLGEFGLAAAYFGMSAADFLWAVRYTTDLNRPSIGVNQSFSLVDWYPGAVNPYMSFFGFDGFGFALDSPQMREAVSIAAELHSLGHTFEGLDTYTQRGTFPSGYGLGAFLDGQMAFFYGGSWLLGRMINQANFEWDFIGTPGGRAVVALEIVGISHTTSYPEEAFKLASWMGHGTNGNLHRLSLAEELGTAIESLPVTQNPYVLAKLMQIIPSYGLQYIYAAMDRVLLDGQRINPGYMHARFLTPTGVDIPGYAIVGVDHVMRHSIMGNLYYPEHSATLEDIVRRQLEAAE